MTTNDPFRHHPGLRALIKPREDSFFADFHVDKAIEIGKQHGPQQTTKLKRQIINKNCNLARAMRTNICP